jgi:hypothetical protein
VAEAPKVVTTPVWPFLHDEGAAGEPDQERRWRRWRGDAAPPDIGTAAVGAAAVAATVAAVFLAEQAVQALVEVAPQLVEVGRAFAGLLAFVGLRSSSFLCPSGDRSATASSRDVS